MKYYLLTYDRRLDKSSIRSVHPAGHRNDAMSERFALEATEGATNADLEIVVLGADSEDALRTTHGRYFDSAEALRSELSSTV